MKLRRGGRRIQSRVRTFRPGFGNGWLKYRALVQFWGWAAGHFEGDCRNLADMLLPNSVEVARVMQSENWTCSNAGGPLSLSLLFFLPFILHCHLLDGRTTRTDGRTPHCCPISRNNARNPQQQQQQENGEGSGGGGGGMRTVA